MKADRVIEILGLEPLPVEGGMWAQTWRDEHSSAIYFLLRPGNFSALHRVEGPEMWHYYAGAAAEMLLLHEDGGAERPRLGSDLEAGERPFVAVPGRVWMAAATTGDWTLAGTTMAPPFRVEEMEMGRASALAERYPSVAEHIRRLTREEYR